MAPVRRVPEQFFTPHVVSVLKDCRVDRPYQAGRSKHWVKVKTAGIRNGWNFWNSQPSGDKKQIFGVKSQATSSILL